MENIEWLFKINLYLYIHLSGDNDIFYGYFLIYNELILSENGYAYYTLLDLSYSLFVLKLSKNESTLNFIFYIFSS